MSLSPPLNTDDIEALWKSYKDGERAECETVSKQGLAKVLTSLGHAPAADEISRIFEDANASSALNHDQFVSVLTAMHGNRDSRLRIAFAVLDASNSGHVERDSLERLLAPFDIAAADMDRLYQEIDRDGRGYFDFADFERMMPARLAGKCGPVNHATLTSDHRIAAAGTPRQQSGQSGDHLPMVASQFEVPLDPKSDHAGQGRGTSRLQMQIGLFRLLQGAAYRSFRESFSANCETHLRARNLPYTMPHFVAFLDSAVTLYKELNIVEASVHHVLDELTDSVKVEFDRLMSRISNWQTVDKSPEMQKAAEDIARDHSQKDYVEDALAAGVDLALTLRKRGEKLSDLGEHPLDLHEINRLRQIEIHSELTQHKSQRSVASEPYIKTWNRVLIEDASEDIAGAIMPVAYWYDDFMPKLLAACSVGTRLDLPDQVTPNEPKLEAWFSQANKRGEFAKYGTCVPGHFEQASPQQKLSIRQAWRLTRHYLNGVQKRREREEFGRESGFLSQYVAFIDVFLGRTDVAERDMRVSFPYYLGPPTWRFLHTSAEIICTREASEQERLVELFKSFFQAFATIYPCPFCRYHLNRYVIRNREVTLYPLEYLILGLDRRTEDIVVDFREKLSAINDGPSLRLFLWKMHNAVSASVSRTEPWFRFDDKAIYTTRHWPSLDSELARARTLEHNQLPIDQLENAYDVTKTASSLAAIHKVLDGTFSDGAQVNLGDLLEVARDNAKSLDQAILASGFLQETYAFNPGLCEDSPHFTAEEEVLGRSGVYVED